MIFGAIFGGDGLSYFIHILFGLIAGYLAIVLHEIAHGVVAMWNGDYTAKNAGRLTMNPIKHFDLIGFIMIMTVGFGYAKPVPVNPYNFKHYRKGLITVSIAGIALNMILAFFSALFSNLSILGFNSITDVTGRTVLLYLADFFTTFSYINLSLFFFNLLPIFPLDGFRLVEALTHQGNKFCAFMRTNGRYILWGLVGLSFIVSMAYYYAPGLPTWFRYIDILGTYLNYCRYYVNWAFTSFWALMMPGV